MDLIKLLPILFVVAQGEGRAVEPQTLPAIPGYVPVYIQEGPVEVIYRPGKRDAVQGSQPEKVLEPEGEKVLEPEAEKVLEPEAGKEPSQQPAVVEMVSVEKEKAEKPAEPIPAPSASEQQQNIINESGAPADEETAKKEDTERMSRGIGSVLEIGSYQLRK